jgi:hypothetical protein
LDTLKGAILASIAITILGIALLTVPFSGPDYKEATRVDVGLMAGMGTGGKIHLSGGSYEVCVLDLNNGAVNYSNLVLRLTRNGKAIPIEGSDGSPMRDLDGARCEVVRSFHITLSDSYSYHLSMNGLGDEDWVHFELIFIRFVTRLDQPIYVAGLSLIAVGLAGMSLPAMYLRKSRPRPDR